MYAIMKLEYEAPIYDDFGFGALKGGILKCRLDWAIPEKKKTRGLRIYIFEKTLRIFCFFTLPLEIPDKIKLHPWKFHKVMLPICVTSLGNSKAKIQDPWKFRIIFSLKHPEIPLPF